MNELLDFEDSSLDDDGILDQDSDEKLKKEKKNQSFLVDDSQNVQVLNQTQAETDISGIIDVNTFLNKNRPLTQ